MDDLNMLNKISIFNNISRLPFAKKTGTTMNSSAQYFIFLQSLISFSNL